MHYQHLKTVRKINKYVLLIVPLLVVLFFLLRSSSVSETLTNLSHSIGKPFWSLKSVVLENLSEELNLTLQTKEQLYSENAFLRSELARLERETFMLNALEADNEKLHEQLGYTAPTSGYISAAILHNVLLAAHDVFIIDVGSEQGVRDNMLILTPEGIAIGYVSKVFETTAVARRFSAPTTNIDVVIESASTTQHATLVGYGSGTMKLTVPRDVALEKDDTLLLPMLSTHPIATVASIQVSPEDAYKTAYLRSPVNMYELRFVYIDTTHTWDTKEAAKQVELSLQPKEVSTEGEEEEDTEEQEGDE